MSEGEIIGSYEREVLRMLTDLGEIQRAQGAQIGQLQEGMVDLRQQSSRALNVLGARVIALEQDLLPARPAPIWPCLLIAFGLVLIAAPLWGAFILALGKLLL